MCPANGTRTFENWDLTIQTLANGKAKGSEWTVLVGPHRDSRMWVNICLWNTYSYVKKMRKQVYVFEVHKIWRVSVIAGELQSKEGRKQETHAQSYMKQLPWLRGAFLDKTLTTWAWAGKTFSEMPTSSHICSPITPCRTQKYCGYLLSRRYKKMAIMSEQKTWGRPARAIKKKKKKSDHCAVSTRERPLKLRSKR